MLAWRKPLAMVSGVVVMVVFFGSWVTGKDIPSNACDLGKWYITIILGAAYGSSTIESISASGKALQKDTGGGYGYYDGTNTTKYSDGGAGESIGAKNDYRETNETG